MTRNISNIIRFMMDEFIPPIIRDSYWFMYPFFYVGSRGNNVSQIMNFKSLVHNFSEEEYIRFYSQLNSVSRRRKTDISNSNLNFLLKNIDKNSQHILDVGCGNGYLLTRIKKENPDVKLTGFDVVNKMDLTNGINFFQGNITSMPFKDNEFDTVICTHTIEHILHLETSINELVRITKNQLIIVTPCQRYFYYTLDEHINFFQKKEMLTSLFPFVKFACQKINFDWVYVGYK